MANLGLLPRLLKAAPPDARIVLLMPPMHVWHQQQHAANYRECKARVLEIVAPMPRVQVLDYLLDSALTRRDENYWDAIHYGDDIAVNIERDIAAVLAGRFTSQPGAVQRGKP